MKTPTIQTVSSKVLSAIAWVSLCLASTQTWAQPSNRPLLTNQAGAKPNLMIALDNSGSMAYPYHETYALQFNDNNNNALRYCPSPTHSWDPAEGYVRGGRVVLLGPGGRTCVNSDITFWLDGDTSQAYVPALTARNNWFAQRSADVNPVYYNPRTTYAARLGPDYLPLSRPTGVRFISNQQSTTTGNAFYQVYRNPTGGALYVVHAQKPAPSPRPTWATPNDTGTNNSGNRVYGLPSFPFPTHAEIANNGDSSTPTFDYTYCSDADGFSTVQKDAAGKDIGCSSVRSFDPAATDPWVSVYAPGHPNAATNVITLAPDHKRTDCGTGATSCTNQQELNNILNWYHWYSTRQLATSTAIGQALAGNDFQEELRIGYLPINDFTQAGTGNLAITKNPAIAAPGTTTGDVNVLRGVRTLQGGTTASTELYSFLNGIQSRGGTPLHNAVSTIGSYYSVPAGAVENPWSTNPAALATTDNPEMSCRRSFNLLFSDGGWTQSYAPPAGPDYDNINGPTFSRTLADGSTDTFRYLRTGDPSVAGRIQYTPYPSADRGGLADLTANYFWHTDLRTALANQVQTRTGQPTFWQNMTTYTVGYMIRPTAEVTGGAGLTFNRIDQYKRDYAISGYTAATKPVWPTGDLAASSTNQERVDDFIHAGFTGGGRSFSATTSNDVRDIFNTIIAEILSASGRDAGVSVSNGGGSNTTLAGRLKYSVSYRTLDNSGDIAASELDASGAETGVVAWSANALMPTAADRRMFTMSGTDQPTDFSGTFSSLPSDVKTALASGPDASRIPNGAGFINYLRGDNSQTDAFGRLFRQREVNASGAPTLAAMVNPPSVYMGDSLDYAYDLDGSGGVDGRAGYLGYTNRKRGYPKSLYVATNAGTMHAFEALTGIEMAAFKPRRSLTRMLNYAADPYRFEYVLDGPVTENDVFDRAKADSEGLTGDTEWRAWRHLAVGTGGRGEPLVYAINSPIKPAALGDPANRIPDKQDFLWETGPDIVNAADNGNVTMGYIANDARTGQTEDLALSNKDDPTRGRWIVAVNNGHYNGEANGEKAGLVVLDAITGDVIRTIPLPNGYSAGRGLSGVTLLRSYGTNTRVVAAYAGDANGQLWRFNLTGEPSTWHVSHGRPLFTVPGNRPIFGHPAWQKHSSGGFIVVFATGIALEENDLSDLGDQSIYGIWDRMELDGTMLNGETFSPVTNTQLESRASVRAGSVTRNGFTFFAITGNNINWKTRRGWRLPMTHIAETDASLRAGERSIANVQNYLSNVIITSTILRPPASGEMCSVSDLPGNYIYNLNAQEGSPERSRSYDVDGDGRLDAYAIAYAPAGGFSRGIRLTRTYTNSSGVALPEDAYSPPSDPSDPVVTESEASRLGDSADEPSGESRIAGNRAPKCRTVRGVVLGTGANPLPTGVFCPTTGWNRTQFQLSTPPTN